MTTAQQLITVGLCVLGTVVPRFLPFLCFSSAKPTPPVIRYLGKALPSAVFAMLVVYALRHVPLAEAPHGLPELAGVAVTVLLHVLFRRMLISIAGGTLLYMLLVQTL